MATYKQKYEYECNNIKAPASSQIYASYISQKRGKTDENKKSSSAFPRAAVSLGTKSTSKPSPRKLTMTLKLIPTSIDETAG